MPLYRRIAEAGSTIRWYRGLATTRTLYSKAFPALGPGSNIMKPRALRGLSGVSIGSRFTAYPGLWLQCEVDKGPLHIGDDAMIGYNNHIHAYDPITIGDRLQIASNAMINSGGRATRFESYGTGEIVIGDDVFVGQNVSILGGVHIGDHVTIAAGAVVTRDIPSHSIVGGVPAKVIGSQAPTTNS